MLAQDGDASLVATIIQLAHRMGVPTVAEGIELETQALALKALGCDLGQGFLTGRPALPQDLVARLLQPQEQSAGPARPGPERRSA